MTDKQKIQSKVGYKYAGRTFFAVVLAFLYATVGILGFSQNEAQAAIPKVINFQGKLTNVSNGTNVANGNYTFEFKIYDDISAGSLLWTETWDGAPAQCPELAVTNGVFNAKLGECNPLTIDFTGGDLYLSVNFDDGGGLDGEMVPRKQFVSSAYAFVANSVSGDGVVNNAIQSATALSTGRTSANPALQVDTNTGSSVTGLKVTSAAAAGGVALAAISSGTNENITLDAKGSGTISINGSATGDILLGGGSASTGCTVTNSSGAFACTAGLTGVGVNASTGLLQGQLGLTVTGAAVSLNDSSNFAVNIATGTNNALTTIGGGSGTFSLQTTNIDISSGGAITGATGLVSSGTIQFSALTTNGALYTSGGNGTLTTTAPTSGAIGYWSRASTTLSPTTANDIVSIANTTTTGADLALTNSGVYTGTGVFNLTANSATTGTLASITGNGLTTGSLLSLSSSSAAALTGQTGLNIALTGALTGAQTTYGAQISNTRTGGSAVNVGLYATASGATGGNYAAIFEAGFVGVGTTAPNYKLQIGAGSTTIFGNTVYDQVIFDTDHPYSAWRTSGGVETFMGADNGAGYGDFGTASNHPMSIGTNSLVRMTIEAAGEIGIATSLADRQLEINSATGDNLRLTYNDADGTAANYADLLTTSAGALTIQPSGFIANIGGGTTRTALRFLEPSGTGTDYAAIQSHANVTTSYTWSLPAADASGCIQSNGSGQLSISACGGAITPWTSDIDADGYDLRDLSNLEFRDTTGAPAGSVVAVFSDNTGDLNINSLTGKTTNIQVNGTDEYNFSSTALAMNSNNITGVGTAITATAGLTVTATAADLTLATATSGNINLNSTGGTIELQDATNITGALDVSTTLAVGTADAFTVNASGAITAVVGITNTGAQSTTVQSATALTVARTGTNYALQVDTNTASSVTGIKITSAAAAGGVAIAAISSGTDEFLTLDAKGAGEIRIAGASTGSILFAGGAGSTGCTITTAGALTCDGAGSFSNLSGSSSGTNTGDVTLAAIGATPNANGATLTGQALNLQPANGSFGGVVSTTTQTFAGAKTFTSDVTVSKVDPSLVLVAPGSDTDFWLSVTDDGGNDDNDAFQIGDGATPGTNTLFSMDNAGNITLATGALVGLLPTNSFEFVSGQQLVWTGDGGNFMNLYNGSNDGGIMELTGRDVDNTSGAITTFNVAPTVIPTSGTLTYAAARLSPTINQTGTATGVTRGLYVNPTITSSKDFRGMEASYTIAGALSSSSNYGSKIAITNNQITNANTVYGQHISFTDAGSLANAVTGLYVDATTANSSDTTYAAIFQGGNVGIGTSAPAYKLVVDGGSGNGYFGFDVSNPNPTLFMRGDVTNGYYPNIDFAPQNNTALGGVIQSNSISGGLYIGNRGVSGALIVTNDVSNRTNTILDELVISHNTTGTPAANYGTGILISGETTTTATQDMSRIAAYWTDATHATRTSNLGFSTALNGTLSEKLTIQGNGQVGIGTTSSDARLELAGNQSQAAWGLNGIQLQATAATYTDSSTAVSGTATNAVFNSFAQPTLAATNATVTTTNASTVYIANAPATGTNQTITNAYALWVDDGNVRFDGNLTVTGTCTGCGGGTFSGEVDDTTNDSLTFTTDDASAPAGTVNSIFRDNTGDMNINTVTGKTLNLQIAGTDEYNFSNLALAMNSNNITGVGTAITATAGLTVTATAADLNLATATSGNINLNSTGGTIELQDATNITGALDVSTTLAVGTADAFQVSTAGTVTIATGQSYTGAGTVTLSSAAASALTIESGTTGTLTIGGDSSDETISIGLGAAVKGLYLGSSNTTSLTQIQAGSTGISLLTASAGNIALAPNTTGSVVVTSGVTTGTGTSSGLSVAANSLTTGVGVNLASSSLSSGSLLNLAVTGIAGLDNQKGINVSMSGANGTGAQTTYGGYFSNTHTGTSTNVGLYATATGGSNNYAAIFENGNVGIGTTTPAAKLDIMGFGASSSQNIRIRNEGQSAQFAFEVASSTQVFHAPQFSTLRARGTLGSPSVVSSGDALFLIDAAAYDSDSYESAARITFDSDGASGNNDVPGRITFATTADGGVSPTERLRVESSGEIGIATTAPDKQLEINSATGQNLRLTYNDADGSATNYADLLTTSSGDLSVVPSGGDVGVTGSVAISSILQVASATGTTYSRFGTGTTTHSGAGNIENATDLLLSDDLEVDGDAWFDGNLTVTGTCTGCGGGSFSGEVDDTTNDSLTFTSDDASAPAGTVNSIFRDNTGDLNINTVTGKTLNIQIAGADEYNFSATALALNSNNITGVGTAITAAAALTLSTAAASDLTLDSGTTGAVNLGTGNNAKTISIGTGNAGNGINIGTNNTVADTIAIGSALDSTTIRGSTITIGNAADASVSIIDNNWSVTTAGVATFVTGSVIGSQTFTTNNIADSGALTIATGANGALTLNPNGTGALINTLDSVGDINDMQLNRSGTLTSADSSADILASRTVVTNSAGSLNSTANFVQFTSNISGTGTDTGSVLGVTQSNTSASGAVVSLAGAGTGNLISADTTNSSANGALFDIQSSSASQYALMATVNNGGTTALRVGGDGFVGLNTTGADRRLDILDSTNPQLRLSQADGTVYGDLQSTTTANLIVTGDNLTSSSAKEYGLQISPTINQTSAASYTALDVNVTETAATTANGLNRLADFKVGGSSKLAIANDGTLTLQNASNLVTAYGSLGAFQNHLVRSEEFDNASWTKSNVTAPTANTQTAPDGSTTAESLVSTVNGGYAQQATSTAITGVDHTFSVWVRSASGTQAFDLELDGTTGGTAIVQSHTATTSWQRFSVTGTVSGGTGNVQVRIYPGGTGSTGTIYVANAQLEVSSRANAYALTTGGALTNTNRGESLVSNFATTSGFTYGGRHIINLEGAISASSSTIGQLIRVNDNATGTDDTATVRALEVQSFSGTNINGINTAIAAFGYTFGVHAVSTGQANETAQPAAVFADLDNGSAPTQGNAIRAYSNNLTSADLVSFYHETTTFTGNGLEMNFGNSSGAFSGNFISLQKAGTQYFHVDDDGSTHISVNGTATNFGICLAADGNVNDTEIVQCNGAPTDLAENFGTTDSSIEAGDVVVSADNASAITTQDGTDTSKAWITKSGSAYQNNLLGVVSTQPNQVYGTDGLFKDSENPRPVSLAGRVPVKVTNENGNINAGDYLTSSSTQPGKAMKATRSGVVIGQALSSYDGTGEPSVIVFVNTGYQSIGNTIVLDAPSTTSLDLQSGEENLTTNTASTFVIQQQTADGEQTDAPESNILQLQTGDANRFMVSSTGATSILSNLSCDPSAPSSDCPSVLKVTQANTELMNIDARGTLTLAGTIFIKDDSFAGSVATDSDGLAEITFSYHLGTGKPVVQLTAEAQLPVFAQIVEFKKDEAGNYTGFVMKTFDLISGPIQAIVHYTVVGKQADYITLGEVQVAPDYSEFSSGDGSGGSGSGGEFVGGDGVGLIIEGGEVVGGNGEVSGDFTTDNPDDNISTGEGTNP